MYIIADEVYQLLYFDKKPDLPLYYYGANVFSLSSFSKILAPSLRLGWIQCNDKLMKMLSGCGQLDSSGGINPFISRIVHNIINNGDLDENIIKTREILKQRCDVLCDSLSGLKYNKPDGGYFIWIETPFDSRQFLTFCEDKQIKFHTGNKFSGHGRLENCLRLSFSFYDTEGLQIGGTRLSSAYTEYLDIQVKTQIYVYGATGRLGSKICKYASDSGYNVVKLNRDLTNLSQVDDGVIIDVTSVDGTNKLVSILLHQNINIPLIIGTTGKISVDCNTNIMDYSKTNTVFKVSNFSYGIPAIEKILNTFDTKNWNISVKETHHINKLDRPSGTAKTLANTLDYDFDNIKVVREGEVFGKHEITFDTEHEQIKIIHEAKDRDIFARGSLRFIELIKESNNGYYESNFGKTKEFTRYSVCGNTFIITNNYPIDKEFIITKCNEYDVDGFIWYTIEDKSKYDFEWKFWNNDGLTADMCLNGSRAISYHVSKLLNMDKLFFRSFSNIDQNAIINMKKNIANVSVPEYMNFEEYDSSTYFVNVGVNHTIKYINTHHENFDTFNLESFYKEMNKIYRSNVSIVTQIMDHSFKIRTFEKGVEAETGACGTACIAAYYKIKDDLNAKYFIPPSNEKIRIVKDDENILISSEVKEI
jgi:diaminopimelate epimerase